MEYITRKEMPDLYERLIAESEKADDAKTFLPYLKKITGYGMEDTVIEVEALMDQEKPVGYYALLKKEFLQDNPGYSPWISGLYVFEQYRSRRLSPVLIERACEKAAGMGYFDLYAATELIGYLERYRFEEIGLAIYYGGDPCKLYRRVIRETV